MIVVVKNSPFGRHSSSHCGHFQCLFGRFLHALKQICEMLQALTISWFAQSSKNIQKLPPRETRF